MASSTHTGLSLPLTLTLTLMLTLTLPPVPLEALLLFYPNAQPTTLRGGLPSSQFGSASSVSIYLSACSRRGTEQATRLRAHDH